MVRGGSHSDSNQRTTLIRDSWSTREGCGEVWLLARAADIEACMGLLEEGDPFVAITEVAVTMPYSSV
ncbi:hypothetical protein NPX13_g9109 [Xylaria arbuscula]|uniref:Uncharacterized protein n=1 Tax=Xylaria arbuscula TaxID=114810 RepID=A0A9W8TJ77_9PEZI|nr:hypothetical protein NPX13_g9109 [Xylaria arbuscula]